MATSCHSGLVPLGAGGLAVLPSSLETGLDTGLCSPREGLCFYSLSRADGQETAQFGCWPSQATLPRAWLGQPPCRQSVDSIVCLCSSDDCNLRLPQWTTITPEGTQVQGLLVLTLLLCCLLMLATAAYCQYRTWRQSSPSSPPSDIEASLTSSPRPRAGSRCLLLPSSPPWLISSSPSPLCSSLSSPPTLLRVSSAPPSIPASRARTNLAFLLHGEQCPCSGPGLQGAGRS